MEPSIRAATVCGTVKAPADNRGAGRSYAGTKFRGHAEDNDRSGLHGQKSNGHQAGGCLPQPVEEASLLGQKDQLYKWAWCNKPDGGNGGEISSRSSANLVLAVWPVASADGPAPAAGLNVKRA